MRYERIARYVAQNLWAITAAKMTDLVSVLAYRASGQEFTPEEIKARIGDGTYTFSPTPASIAVVPIRGTIAHRMGGMDESSGGTSTERIGAVLAQLAADDTIKTIVYDCDSPGGTVPGVPELAAQMFALRGVKRQVAQINSMACSAAYWLASQCDEIVSIPTGMAGSIGVFSAHENLAGALEKEGIQITLMSAGKHKLAGNPFGPLSDDDKAVMQARVDDAYAQFVRDVARGRGVMPAAVRNGYGEGRALDAKDAKAAGMIDRIATMDETIARLTARPARAGAGGMRGTVLIDEVNTHDSPALLNALSAAAPMPPPEKMEPNEDGECEDGYEMGDDGMCHMTSKTKLADPKSRESIDAQQEQERVWDIDQDRARRLRVV